jgi:DNA mismatch repair protein MutS
MKDNLSPVRQQYLEIKRQYPGAILFFRLGDFYETFDADAETAARELDIVLTSRNVAKGARVPMAGIPHHAVESYLAKLISRGYHVAICEQMGETPVKGLFPRQVVRVVTPGTVVEPGLLPGDANNYLAAALLEGERVGLAYADISTGEFAATETEAGVGGAFLRLELTRLRPAEILVPESTPLPQEWESRTTHLPAWQFEAHRAESALLEHFRVGTLAGFGLADSPLAQRAAGALLAYLTSTQPAALPLLTGLSSYALGEFMALDTSTRRNLELTETLRSGAVRGSLLGVLDAAVTPMGRRLLQQWIGTPLLDRRTITQRLDEVQALHGDGLWRAELRQALDLLGDLERLVNRASAGLASPRDLAGLRENLQHLPEIAALGHGHEAEPVGSLLAGMDVADDLRALLERALVDQPPATLTRTGVIRPGFSEKLDDVAESSRKAREWIAGLESVERERTGIKSLKVGYNKVFGYYIEVTKANAELVPADYIRKQTLVNGERYITPEMKEYEAIVLTAEERIRDIEAGLFAELCRSIGEQSGRLLHTARLMARLDVVAGLAEVAARHGYCRPELCDEDALEIRDGRHPVVEQHLGAARFVPNDTVLEAGERIRVITGPNMSGKSTYLRQVALIVLMAQMGSFVPARSARLGVTDRIFTRIGAQDEIHAGQSTFMVEMVETANILHHATGRSLVILDEIGRGTSTYDGLSIAWAVLEYLHNHPRLRARTLFATHFHELTRLAEVLPGVRNFNVAVSEEGGQVVFLHKIVPGGADRSYGIHVAELAGLPRPVINRAQEILAQLESDARQAREASALPVRQLALFPETNPLLESLRGLDVASLTPLEALNKLYEWQVTFLPDDGKGEPSGEASH